MLRESQSGFTYLRIFFFTEMTEPVDVVVEPSVKRQREDDDAVAAAHILIASIDSTAGDYLQDLILTDVIYDFPQYAKTDADRERLSDVYYLLTCLIQAAGIVVEQQKPSESSTVPETDEEIDEMDEEKSEEVAVPPQ